MRYTDNAINIIATKTYKGIGRAWIVKHLQGNESEEQIVALINDKSKQPDFVTVEEFENVKRQIIRKIERLGASCDGVVAMGDQDFPPYRGEVKASERPIFLFYKGNLDLIQPDNNNITVIGLLNPDNGIEKRERSIVSLINKEAVTIVSGLAFGCDSIAHQEALNGGKTVAILPSPLDNILPAKNKDLAYQIYEDGGLLITEYYENFRSKMELSNRYKERDRLQALYCDTIILVASYDPESARRWGMHGQKLDSGARLAMEFARQYKIPRAVMYDHDMDSQNPMFDLNRTLIKSDRNVVVLTPKRLDDVIQGIKTKKESQGIQTGLFD